MSTEHNADQIIKDLKVVVRDADDLVRATAGEVSDKAREARARLAAAVESAKRSCERWENKALESARATDETIRQHPYESLGVAFALGALLGILVSRK